MSTDIKESDWKIFRELHPVALERAFDKAIADIQYELAGKGTSRERFWDVAELVKQQRKDIRDSFDGMSRSNALLMIIRIRREGFLTDEEISRFSDQTQAKVRGMVEISKKD